MVRRCMEGNRRFGAAEVAGQDHTLCPVFCEVSGGPNRGMVAACAAMFCALLPTTYTAKLQHRSWPCQALAEWSRSCTAREMCHRHADAAPPQVEITECEQQPDGRYGLEITGRRRMRVVGLSELDGYRIAQAEELRDAPITGGARRTCGSHVWMCAHVDGWVGGLAGSVGWAFGFVAVCFL